MGRGISKKKESTDKRLSKKTVDPTIKEEDTLFSWLKRENTWEAKYSKNCDIKKELDSEYHPVISEINEEDVWFGAIKEGKDIILSAIKIQKNEKNIEIEYTIREDEDFFYDYDKYYELLDCPEKVLKKLTKPVNMVAAGNRSIILQYVNDRKKFYCEWPNKNKTRVIKLNRKSNENEIKKIIDKKYHPIKSAYINNIWYGAVKYKIAEAIVDSGITNILLVIKTSINNKNELTLIEMPEQDNPEFYDCPYEVLKELSGYYLEWSERTDYYKWRCECIEYQKEKFWEFESLSNITLDKKIYKDLSDKNIKKYFDEKFGALESAYKYGVWYGAVRYYYDPIEKEDYIYALVISVDKKRGNSLKITIGSELTEDDDFCIREWFCECPEKVLNALTPASNSWDEGNFYWRCCCERYNNNNYPFVGFDWDSNRMVTHINNISIKAIKKRIDDLYKPIKSSYIKNTWFGAVNYKVNKENYIGLLVVPTKVAGSKIMFHDISECSGWPWNCTLDETDEKEAMEEEFDGQLNKMCSKCPKQILNILTEPKKGKKKVRKFRKLFM